MNSKLEAIQDKFLESLGRMSDDFGLNGFVAKLYGILYLNAKPLSLDEIAEALGVTKGNVSINIRELEKWGAVRKIWIKGSRKDFYEADLNIKKILSDKIKAALHKRITEISVMVEGFDKAISSANGELTDEEKDIASGYLQRLKKIEELKNLASAALTLADKLF